LPDKVDKITLNPATWVNSLGDYLFSYAFMKVGDRQVAEDLVQDTFVSGIRAKDTFKGESSEKTWLVAILKNKIIDHYRKKDVLRNTTEYLDETEVDFTKHFFDLNDGHWISGSAPAPWSASADNAVESEEFETILQMCIQKMPPKLIPVFVAKFIDDEDSEIICKVHGISSSNYWVMIHRAKVLIRSCLEKNWFLTKR
jgi:RNA polymerase sigma-70 factor (TIGR02943 family)